MASSSLTIVLKMTLSGTSDTVRLAVAHPGGKLLPDVMAVLSENSLNIPTVHLTVELVLIAWTPLCSAMIYLTKKIEIHLEMKPRFPKKTSETFDVMRCLV